MKTFINKSNPASVGRYLELFDMADKALAAAGKSPTDAEGNVLKISSLEQYFTCIGTLKSLEGGAKFAYLLPLDESFFEIDANTRAIKVPNEFSKGVGVQSDVISETLLFKINRFIDAKDLNDVSNIWIQWQYGNLGAPTKEGVFKVSFRYIDYDPDYLIFAWPLMGEVTKAYGTLRFSIRFETIGGDGVSYSLNTLPAAVVLNPALKPDLKYETEPESADVLFNQAIQDSQQTSTPSDKLADRPNFARTGGLILPEKAYLKNNSLKLQAKAIVTDTGDLSYIWHISDGKTEEDVALKTEYVETSDLSRVQNKRYYKEILNGDALAYSLYSGEIENGKTDDGAQLYEYVAIMEIPAGEGQIAGKYQLDASNRIGWSAMSTASEIPKNGNADGWTQYVTIPTPEILNFQDGKDLPLGQVFITDEKVDLNVAIDYDNLGGYPGADAPKIVYNWERTTDPREGNITIIGEEEIDKRRWLPVPSNEGEVSMDIADFAEHLQNNGENPEGEDLPGWYRVKVTSTVNRASKTITSQECKVTRDPVVPELQNKFDENGDNNITIPTSKDESVPIKVKILNAAKYVENPLESDKLSYQWWNGDYAEENGSIAMDGAGFFGKLTKDNIVGEDVEFETVLIASEQPEAFYCIITNELNGKTVEAISSYYILI